jgi:hypothetical protein
MIHENEIVMLMLGVGVLVFLLSSRHKLRRLPSWSVLIASYCVLVSGWFFTILEGFLWGDLLNFMEHACYVGSSALLAVWSWKAFGARQRSRS